MHTLTLILLAAFSLLTISLQRTYRMVTIRELKRRAREGDEVSRLLHRAAAYGHSLRAVLWFLVGVSNAAFFLLAALYMPAWFALTASASLIWIGFVWLPARRVSRLGRLVAARLAPVFAWLLIYLHPPLDRLILFVKGLRPVTVHTGLYDRNDLLELLERQQVQADSRVEKTELEIAKRALGFGDIMVREAMTPRRVVKMVAIDETIGPVLMSELHDSGHSRFPVYNGKPDNVVGTLFLRDVIKAKDGGRVKDAMRSMVSYVHEEQTLADALQAILKTHHHLFIVVNSFEEYAGIITIEDVLEQIVGSPIIDEFDQYEDLRAVAARSAKIEHQEHQQKKSEQANAPEATDQPAPKIYKPEDIDDHIEV